MFFGGWVQRCQWLAATTVVLLSVMSPASAQSQDEFPFLRPKAVRAAYESAKGAWSAAPRLVLDAFLTGQDRKFFKRSPSRSTITAGVGLMYQPDLGGQRLAVSAAIAQALSRDEILNWYVHGVFLGQSCFGVDGAARAYFGKQTEELHLHEAALLAALPVAPAQFHPQKKADRALERRNDVLTEMAESGLVSPQEAAAAMAQPLDVRSPLGTCPTSAAD
ncbi:transglycosylase domain-containing protein [Paracoccus sp. S1E-3]|nr:transglycosylase domain-containing protein [Paracoccus sp. S1E-3]